MIRMLITLFESMDVSTIESVSILFFILGLSGYDLSSLLSLLPGGFKFVPNSESYRHISLGRSEDESLYRGL